MLQPHRASVGISIAALLALGAAACVNDSVAPTTAKPLFSLVDPSPGAYGVWLGFGVYECSEAAGATGPDSDQDGLKDLCEEPLATAFAPLLQYTPYDDVRREPRWAARPTGPSDPAGPYKVVIAYLLSYYRDLGDPVHPDSHNGDSEVIGLTVYYDIPTQHWFLEEATYSQHTGDGHYSRGGAQYPPYLEYPGVPGTYPRAYVAYRKHGSYPNLNDCNNGGVLGRETCVDGTETARVETHLLNGESGNIGSEAVPFADCVTSLNASYYPNSGRQECYWTFKRFRGWVPDWIEGEGGDCDPYIWKLQHFGFFASSSPPSSPCGHYESRPILDGNGEETGSYENVWVPEECNDPPCTSGHWESRPILDGNGEETGSYENVWVPDPGCE